MKNFPAIVYTVGLIASAILAVVLAAAAGSVGFQPGPIGYKILVICLMLLPIVAITLRLFLGGGANFDLVAGLAMILITATYLVIMVTVNS